MKIYNTTPEKAGNMACNIMRYVNTGKYHPKGYHIVLNSYDDNENENEIWKSISTKRNSFISNLGRARFGKYGKPTYGSYLPNEGYFGYGGSKIHIWVCIEFNGPKPGPEYSVDHINRNRKDNRACNLRWATRTEQNRNKSCCIELEQFNFYNNEIILTGILQDIITKSYRCKSRTYSDLFLYTKQRDWICRPLKISVNLKKKHLFNNIYIFLQDFKKTNRYAIVKNGTLGQINIPYTKFYKSSTKQFTSNYQLIRECKKLRNITYYEKIDAEACARILINKYLTALTIQTYYRGWIFFS